MPTAVIVVQHSKHAVFIAEENMCDTAKFNSKLLIDIADGLHVKKSLPVSTQIIKELLIIC